MLRSAVMTRRSVPSAVTRCSRHYSSSTSRTVPVVTVGLIGGGETCRAVAQRLVRAGYKLLLYDGDQENLRVQPLDHLGEQTRRVATYADLARESDAVLAMLSSPGNILGVYGVAPDSEGPTLARRAGHAGSILPHVRSGTVIIDCTSHVSSANFDYAGSGALKPHAFLDRLGQIVEAQGADLVSAVVPLHPAIASTTLLVGGRDEALDWVSGVLRCIPTGAPHDMGAAPSNEARDSLLRCGQRAGHAAAMQLCLSHRLATAMVGWAEAAQLAKLLGVPSSALGQASELIPVASEVFSTSNDAATVDIRVDAVEAQLRSVVATARDLQCPVLLGALLSQIYTLLSSGGYGDLNYSAVGAAIYRGEEAAFDNDSDMLSVETIQSSLDAIEAINDENQSSDPTLQAINELDSATPRAQQ